MPELTDSQRAREHLLNEALRAGKFPPKRLAHYRALYDRDPEGTKVLIASLAAGLPPAPTPAGEDGYPQGWLGSRPQGPVTVADD